MCTHIAIIERGKLLVSGSVADILKAMQPARELYVRVLSRSGDALTIVRGFPTVLSSQILPADFKHGQVFAHEAGQEAGEGPDAVQSAPITNSALSASMTPHPDTDERM